MATLGLNATTFQAGLEKAIGIAKSAGGRITSALGGAAANQLAGFVSVAAVVDVSRRTIEYAGQVEDLSDRLGISTESVQAWDYALKQSGSSIEAATPFLDRLSKSRQKALEGNDESIASFRRLGVTLEDLKTKRLEDIGVQISEAVKGGDVQALMADLQAVGGKGAGELAAAFKSGFSEAVAGAKELGVVISDDVISKLDEAGDRMQTTWAQFRAQLAPALAWLGNALTSAWRGGNIGMRGAVGFLTGGMSGAKDLVREYKDELAAQDAAAEASRARRKAGRGKTLSEEADKEAQKASEKSAERVLRLKEELFRAQQEAAFKAMTKEQQLQELMRRRRAILDYISRNKTTEEGRMQAAVDVAKLDEQMATLDRTKGAGSSAARSVNSLQQVGAYAAIPVEMTALATHRQNERHLAKIDEKLGRLVGQSGDNAF